MDPARFEDMRPGCYDIEARVADMDINGVWASLCFPSLVAGFCGSVFMRSDDPELGLACLRAWNDWHLEVWAGTHPERIIPLQLPWLADVDRRGRGRPCQRRAWLQGGQLPRVPRPARACPRSSPTTGTRSSPRARRPRRWCASTPAPRRGRPFPLPHRPSSCYRPSFRSTRSSPRPSGSGRASPFASRSSTSPCRRAAWAGSRCSPTGWTTSSSHSASGTESVSLAVGPPAERGAPAELLVLLDRRSVDGRPARRDRGGPHHGGERLPPRRLDLAGHPEGARGRRSPRLDETELRMVAAGNAARLFRHPLPPSDDWRVGSGASGGSDRASAQSGGPAQGLVVIAFPSGESTYQRPPRLLRAWPVAWPGCESPTQRYSGHLL